MWRIKNRELCNQRTSNWQKNNKEKVNLKVRNWRKKNKDRYKLTKQKNTKDYYIKHKEVILEKKRNYHRNNKDILNEKSREYLTTKNGIYASLKHSAERRALAFNMSFVEFIDWYNRQPQNCFYCKRTLEEINNTKDILNNISQRLSIDRMDNNKGYEINNIVLACRRCNTIKSGFFTSVEMLKIGKIIQEKYKKKNILLEKKQAIEKQLSLL